MAGTRVKPGRQPEPARISAVPVRRWHRARETAREDDWLSVEEPLQLLVGHARGPEQPLTTTLRTPGADIDLAYGLLRAEGFIHSPEQILSARHCGPAAAPHGSRNILKLTLRDDVTIAASRMARFSVASASCGLCGKTALEALTADHHYRPAPDFRISAALLHRLPEALRAGQSEFARSGGLHAAAVVDRSGEVLSCREDIGRHNAVDKVLGDLWRHHRDTRDALLLLSGRAGFELIQKALVADLPLVAAIGAPSSLAWQLADNHGITLVGFLRDERFNVYSAPARIVD